MKGKSVGLVILWWSEVIISLRALLFTVPVIINKILAENFILSDPENRFIILLTLTAVFYLLSGLTSIVGFKFWKYIHFAAALFTVLLTVSALNGEVQISAGLHYFYPVMIAVIFTVFAVILDKKADPS